MEAKDRLIIPLDVSTLAEAEALVARLAPHVGLFKIGLQLFHSEGPAVIEAVQKVAGPVFYDGKFYDIPNTVAGAAAAITRLGVKMFNVHALGGKAMMLAAREAAECTASALGIKRPLVLGVTIVTSIDETVLLEECGIGRPLEEEVLSLARLAQEAGLDGVVASVHEAPAIREACGQDFLIVCPGIRPAGTKANDQARLATPQLARDSGADYIVVGRPITGASEPVKVAQAIAAQLGG
jgi:orotidine-5'-phosphate decarboxylase